MLRDMLSRAARRLARGEPARLAEAAAERARGLAERGELEAAAEALERSLEIDPRSAKRWGRLANMRFELGAVDAAIAAYRRALEHDSGMPQLRTNLLFALAHRSDDPEALLAEHLAWSALVSEDGPPPPGLRNDPDPARPLRVGYLSADFKGHAISMFVEPLLARHDPARVIVHCYDNAPSADEVARRLRGYGAVWREVRGLDGAGFRRQVIADGIDVLVDLSGHTAGNRLPDLARRVAPVQATYLGYHGTTGLAAMDYRITDAYADPPGQTETHYVEKLARMPHCLWCYRPARHEPERLLPAERRTGEVVLASLNNLRKIAPPVVALWARLLLAVPEARLVIAGAADGPASRDLLSRLAGDGVDPARVECIGWLQPADFAALHARIDVALDTYPFNGGTTTIEALARGVPVVSWSGRTAASRCGRTILTAIGLPELLADSAERYVEIAAGLARDRERLAALKSDLPTRMRRSAIMDEAAFVEDLEDLYRGMWRDWCQAQRDRRDAPSAAARSR